MNKYLEKAAFLGAVAKANIRNNIAPMLKGMGSSGVSKLEGVARQAAGSKLKGGIFSSKEVGKHMENMKTLGQKKLQGSTPTEANKLLAVAARAKRMGRL